MRILDAGHKYELSALDGGQPQILTFVKREGAKFPFNVGAYGGTNLQEPTRACINRSWYLYDQRPCAETICLAHCYETALLLLEMRAARCHGRFIDLPDVKRLICGPLCEQCGHFGCSGH